VAPKLKKRIFSRNEKYSNFNVGAVQMKITILPDETIVEDDQRVSAMQ
jgi:hypothetical protein